MQLHGFEFYLAGLVLFLQLSNEIAHSKVSLSLHKLATADCAAIGVQSTYLDLAQVLE